MKRKECEPELKISCSWTDDSDSTMNVFNVDEDTQEITPTRFGHKQTVETVQSNHQPLFANVNSNGVALTFPSSGDGSTECSFFVGIPKQDILLWAQMISIESQESHRIAYDKDKFKNNLPCVNFKNKEEEEEEEPKPKKAKFLNPLQRLQQQEKK